MARIIVVALSDQENTFDLATRISELDRKAVVIVTSDLAIEAVEPIIGMFKDIADDGSEPLGYAEETQTGEPVEP